MPGNELYAAGVNRRNESHRARQLSPTRDSALTMRKSASALREMVAGGKAGLSCANDDRVVALDTRWRGAGDWIS